MGFWREKVYRVQAMDNCIYLNDKSKVKVMEREPYGLYDVMAFADDEWHIMSCTIDRYAAYKYAEEVESLINELRREASEDSLPDTYDVKDVVGDYEAPSAHYEDEFYD